MTYKRARRVLAVVLALIVTGIAGICSAKPLPVRALYANAVQLTDTPDIRARNIALAAVAPEPPAQAQEAESEAPKEETEVRGVVNPEYLPLIAMLSCGLVIAASSRKKRR